MLHPTTLFILATIKLWVHKARRLPDIFIPPYIHAAVVQKTNWNTFNWLTVHPTVMVSGDTHHTLIHNLYDKGSFILSGYHEQTSGQGPLVPFHNFIESGMASLWSWNSFNCIRKWKASLFSHVAEFLYLYFCSLINFQHLERKPDYTDAHLSDLITSPADESCWATACAEAYQALY